MALMKTSNPALSENTFRNLAGAGYGGMTDIDQPHDAERHRQQDRHSAALRHRHRGLDLAPASFSRAIIADVAPLMLVGV